MKIFVLLFFSAVALGVDYINSFPCKVDHFEKHWPQLIADEKSFELAIQKTMLEKKAVEPDHYWLFRQCILETPENEEADSSKFQRVRFNSQWKTGPDSSTLHKHGFRVEYAVLSDNEHRVRGYEVCRNPNACKRLGIPFPDPSEPALEFTRKEACTQGFYSDLWPQLYKAEKSLLEASQKSIQNQGTVKPTRCLIQAPSDDENSSLVIRQLVLYQHSNELNANAKMDGVRVEYSARCSSSGCQVAEILSYAICRTEESCHTLGVF